MFTPGNLILDQTYRIEAELGRGAFGVVYRVTHLALRVERAVKVLRSDDDGVGSTVFADYRNRFRLEAQLAARLTHPHVIQVYDFQERDGVLFCVMEYAPGGSLADLLAKEGPLPVERVVRILLDAAAGLEAMHDQLDAVHRDVKPANILLDKKGRAKIADLGLAQVSGLGMSQRSGFGSMAQPHPGTPNYTSPDHKDGSEPLGPTADVYGLGCVAFELLTGQVWKSARRKVKRPSNLRPDLPPWLDAVVVRMLCQEPGLTVDDADDPAKRYVDMASVQAALGAGEEQIRRALAEAARVAAEQERQRAVAAEKARQEAAARAAEEKRKQEEAEAARAAELKSQHVAAEEEKRRQEAATPVTAQRWLDERSEAQARRPFGWMNAIVVLVLLGGVGLFWGIFGNYQEQQEAAGQAAATATAQALMPWLAAQADADLYQATGLYFLPVPAGEFTMGSPDGTGDPDEHPQHAVYLDSFFIGATEVTNAQYGRFVDAGGYDNAEYWSDEGWAWRNELGVSLPGCRDDPTSNQPAKPVICVNWYEADAYTRWLTANSGVVVRLPTEAEWEKACRDSDGRIYAWGNEPPSSRLLNWIERSPIERLLNSNVVIVGVGNTRDVGSRPAGASPYGALDMAGNVWEWTSDWYDGGYYAVSPNRNPTGPTSSPSRVVRGGSF